MSYRIPSFRRAFRRWGQRVFGYTAIASFLCWLTATTFDRTELLFLIDLWVALFVAETYFLIVDRLSYVETHPTAIVGTPPMPNVKQLAQELEKTFREELAPVVKLEAVALADLSARIAEHAAEAAASNDDDLLEELGAQLRSMPELARVMSVAHEWAALLSIVRTAVKAARAGIAIATT